MLSRVLPWLAVPAESAGAALFAFDPGYEGIVELRDAASGKSWIVHTK